MSWTGPDVAYPQGSIDWPAVATDHEFAITRINDGTIRDNQWTEARVKAMDASALRAWGPYTFGEIAAPQNQERGPVAELALCMKFAQQAKWKWPGHLPVAYDYEGMSVNGQSAEKCADHVMGWLRSYVGRELGSPGLYTTPSDWQRIYPYLAERDKRFLREHVWLWLASWGVTNPDPIPPFDEVFVHQHTSTGRSPGISGAVDLNRLLVEPQRFLALVQEKVTTPPAPTPTPGSGGTPAPPPPPPPVPQTLSLRVLRARHRRALRRAHKARDTGRMVQGHRAGWWYDRAHQLRDRIRAREAKLRPKDELADFTVSMLNGCPGNVTDDVKRGIVICQGFGLRTTSTTGGGHSPTSYHYYRPGRAGDAAIYMHLPNAVRDMCRAQTALAERFPDAREIFGPCNWYIKNGVRHSGTFPGHGNHLHFAPNF